VYTVYPAECPPCRAALWLCRWNREGTRNATCTPVSPARSREEERSSTKSEATSGGAAAASCHNTRQRRLASPRPQHCPGGRGRPGGGGGGEERPCQPQCHAADGPAAHGRVQVVAQGAGYDRKDADGVQGGTRHHGACHDPTEDRQRRRNNSRVRPERKLQKIEVDRRAGGGAKTRGPGRSPTRGRSLKSSPGSRTLFATTCAKKENDMDMSSSEQARTEKRASTGPGPFAQRPQ
jgi:hypothetical protein